MSDKAGKLRMKLFKVCSDNEIGKLIDCNDLQTFVFREYSGKFEQVKEINNSMVEGGPALRVTRVGIRLTVHRALPYRNSEHRQSRG